MVHRIFISAVKAGKTFRNLACDAERSLAMNHPTWFDQVADRIEYETATMDKDSRIEYLIYFIKVCEEVSAVNVKQEILKRYDKRASPQKN